MAIKPKYSYCDACGKPLTKKQKRFCSRACAQNAFLVRRVFPPDSRLWITLPPPKDGWGIFTQHFFTATDGRRTYYVRVGSDKPFRPGTDQRYKIVAELIDPAQFPRTPTAAELRQGEPALFDAERELPRKLKPDD